MARADSNNIDICELSLRLQLRKAGMRLKRPQVLIAGNGLLQRLRRSQACRGIEGGAIPLRGLS